MGGARAHGMGSHGTGVGWGGVGLGGVDEPKIRDESSVFPNFPKRLVFTSWSVLFSNNDKFY